MNKHKQFSFDLLSVFPVSLFVHNIPIDHLSFREFRGVRQIIGFLEQRPDLCFTKEHLLRISNWRENFALLSKHNLSFDLQLYPEQMKEAAEFLGHSQ